MDRDRVIDILKRHERELHAHGIAALSLFGSTARGDPHPDSDIDLLIDIAEDSPFSLIDHAGLQLFLSDLLGRETDVVLRRSLRPATHARIAPDEVPVF